ncbi:MAG TPA: hypothetical protein PKY81_11605 [bacterium]|nr:hypothetical protein [bacterium]HPN31593.1 hypothetical protein [bacterium]
MGRFFCLTVISVLLILTVSINIPAAEDAETGKSKILITKEKFDSLKFQLEKNKQLLNKLKQYSELAKSKENETASESEKIGNNVEPSGKIQKELNSTAAEWEKKLNILSEQYNTLQQKTIALLNSTVDKKKYEELENEYDDLRIKYAELNDRLIKLTEQISVLLDGTSKIRLVNSTLKDKIESLVKENKSLTANVEELEKIKIEKIELVKKYEDLQTKFSALMTNSRKLVSENLNLKNSIEEKLALAGINRKELAKIEELNSEKEKLLDSIEEKEKKIDALTFLNKKLATEIETVKKTKNIAEEKAAGSDKKTAEIENINKNLELSLAASNRTADEKTSILKNEISKIYLLYKELQAENKRLKIKNEELVASAENSLKKNSLTESQIAELSLKLGSANKLNSELNSKIKELETKYSSVSGITTNEIKKLKAELDEAEGRLLNAEIESGDKKSASKEKISVLKEQKEKLLALILNYEKEIKNNEKRALEKFDMISKQCDALKEKNETILQANKKIAEQNLLLKQSLSALSLSAKDNNEKIRVSAESGAFNENMTNTEASASNKAAASEAKTSNVEAVSAQVSEFQNQIALLQEENKKLNGIKNILDNKIKEMANKNGVLDIEKNALIKKIEIYERMTSELAAKLQTSSKENDELNKQIIELNLKSNNFDITARSKKQIELYEKKIKELDSKLNDETAKNFTLNERLKDNLSETGKLKEKENLLILKIKDFANLSKEADFLKSENVRLTGLYKTALNESGRTTTDYNQVVDRINELESKFIEMVKNIRKDTDAQTYASELMKIKEDYKIYKEKLVEQNLALLKKLGDLQEKYNSLSGEYAKISADSKNKIENIERISEKLKTEEIEKLINENSELKNNIKQLSDKVLALDSGFKNKEAEYDKIKQLNLTLAKENAELKSTVEKVAIKLIETDKLAKAAGGQPFIELKREIEKYKILVKGIMSDNKSVREKNVFLEKEFEKLSGELNEAKSIYAKLKTEFDALNEALDNGKFAGSLVNSYSAYSSGINEKLENQEKYISFLEDRLRKFENMAQPPTSAEIIKNKDYAEVRQIERENLEKSGDIRDFNAIYKKEIDELAFNNRIILNEINSLKEKLASKQDSNSFQNINKKNEPRNQAVISTPAQGIQLPNSTQYHTQTQTVMPNYYPAFYYYPPAFINQGQMEGMQNQTHYQNQNQNQNQNQINQFNQANYPAYPSTENFKNSNPATDNEIDNELLDILKKSDGKTKDKRQSGKYQKNKNINSSIEKDFDAQLDFYKSSPLPVLEPKKKETEIKKNEFQKKSPLQNNLKKQNNTEGELLDIETINSSVENEIIESRTNQNNPTEILDDIEQENTTDLKIEPNQEKKSSVVSESYRKENQITDNDFPIDSENNSLDLTENASKDFPKKILKTRSNENKTPSQKNKQQSSVKSNNNIEESNSALNLNSNNTDLKKYRKLGDVINLRYITSYKSPEIYDASGIYLYQNNLLRISSKMNGELKVFDKSGKKISNGNISGVKGWVEGISYKKNTNQFYIIDWTDNKSIRVTDSNFNTLSKIQLPSNIEPSGIEITDDNRIFVVSRKDKIFELNDSGNIIRELNISSKLNFRFAGKGIASLDDKLIVGTSEYGDRPGNLIFVNMNDFEITNIINVYDTVKNVALSDRELGFSGMTVDKNDRTLYFTLRTKPFINLFKIEDQSVN